MEDVPKNGFWQFPTLLKLVVLWIGLLCLIQFVTFFSDLFNDTGFVWVNLLYAFGYLSLTVGLITKRNNMRIWTIVWVVVGLLMRVFLLGLMLFNKQIVFGPFVFKLFSVQIPLTQAQWILSWVPLLAFNAGILFVLLRPGTKAIFSDPPIQR